MADIRWIKIITDIFSDEKILLIEAMPEADSIIVIWFKLLCMAGAQNECGIVCFKNRLPYTDEMLSAIMRRPINTIRLALDTFEKFGMIERTDGIISIPNWEKHQNIEGMEKIREQNRIRKQNQRERQKIALLEDASRDVSRDITQQNKNKRREEKNRKECECDNNTHTRVEKSDLVPKNCYGKYQNVFLTNEEYSDLSKELGETMLKKCIEFLSGYVADTNKTYNNHANTIKRWVIDAVKERETKASGKAQASTVHIDNQRKYDYDKLLENIKAN